MTQTSATVRFGLWASPLGELTLATRGQGLMGVWFAGQKYHPARDAWHRDDDDAVLRQAVRQLQAYFGAGPHPFELPLDLSAGTGFQQSVWQALLSIPAGETRTYGDVARSIGRPQSVRAVAAAIGRNPLSIVVPCHRVLGGDGSLTGYAGGLERKAALLAHEGVLTPAQGAAP